MWCNVTFNRTNVCDGEHVLSVYSSLKIEIVFAMHSDVIFKNGFLRFVYKNSRVSPFCSPHSFDVVKNITRVRKEMMIHTNKHIAKIHWSPEGDTLLFFNDERIVDVCVAASHRIWCQRIRHFDKDLLIFVTKTQPSHCQLMSSTLNDRFRLFTQFSRKIGWSFRILYSVRYMWYCWKVNDDDDQSLYRVLHWISIGFQRSNVTSVEFYWEYMMIFL